MSESTAVREREAARRPEAVGTPGTGTRRARRAGSLLLAAALLAGLSACAPEPEADRTPSPRSTVTPTPTAPRSTDTAEQSPGATEPAPGTAKPGRDDGAASDGGNSWPEQDDPADMPKQTAVPASFPADRFVIPAGTAVDDAGERSAAEWFVVLRAPDQAAAAQLWDAVASASGFWVVSEDRTPEGRSAELRSDTLEVFGLTLPQSDGSVLLSYDLTALP